MNITIHRGISQIGGCITEIKTNEARIIIDLGGNLPGCETHEFTPDEVAKLTEGVDAIFYTHFHGDHIGLMNYAKEGVKQYIGEGAKEVMLCKCRALMAHSHDNSDETMIEKLDTYVADTPVIVKDIKITPYYCSHSAFDSYMFKIEAEGKTILHTGDFRGHGYIGSKLIKMLETYIGQVDILISEGTMLNRGEDKAMPEAILQRKAFKIIKNRKCVFVLCSSTDIDRLASFKEACHWAHRPLIVDKYQNNVMEIFTKRTYAKLYQFNKVEDGGTISIRSGNKMVNDEMEISRLKKEGFVILVRPSMADFVQKAIATYKEEKPILIYSMWDGYYNGTKAQQSDDIIKIRSLFDSDNVIDLHTSGHADRKTLADVCRTVNPRLAIIPIHKEAESDFRLLDITDELKDKVVTNSTTINI